MASGLGASLVDGKWKPMLRPEALKEVDPLVTFEHLKGLSPSEVLQLVEPFFETGARCSGPGRRAQPRAVCPWPHAPSALLAASRSQATRLWLHDGRRV
jgi:hypothetical protein